MRRLAAIFFLMITLMARAEVKTAGGVEFSFYPYELKLNHSFNLAAMSRTTTPDVQVAITIDSVTGYGEASMPPYLGESVESVMTFLQKIDPQRLADPFALEAIHSYLDSLAPGNHAAKAAVDIALHDLSGKLMGRPWYAIYGLDPELAPCTSFTITNDTPEVLAQKMAEAEPYKIWKVKMGVPGDRELIETIRRHTDRPLCVDVNQGWHSPQEALENILWLADRNVIFVEQPLDKNDIEGHAWLKEHSPLPIIADEAVQTSTDIPALARAYDGINIKLMKCGGLTDAYKMAVIARGLGLKVMIGCMTETSCAVSAAAQLAPLADWVDLDGNLLIANDIFNGITINDGKVTLSSEAGIGIKLKQ
ncbi:MAG: dipeptide epimerase [Lachnoclostridium sp.]|nr:dipeptide epimerase [Lachnoclostridium sp.]